MFNNDEVTCIGPWYELRINADGSTTFCHAVKQIYVEYPDNFIEWFNNGQLVNEVRDKIKSGISFNGCTNCYHNEKNNLISFRQRRNLQAAIYSGKYFKESLEQSPAYRRMLGLSTSYLPAFMHVTLSNLCNVSCRMCFPAYSTQLATSHKKIGLLDKDKPILNDWTSDDNKWNEFLKLVKNNHNLIALHIMGGEPLFNKRFFDFIDYCIVNDRTDFHLTFVTNGTIYNLNLLEKLKKFKSVQVEISIENLHDTNNYIRINSDFNIVKDNIISTLKFLGNKSVVLRSVPQALSILHYDTLLDFALENSISIDNNVLSSPEHLKCYILPKALKSKICQKLETKYSDILSVNNTQFNTARIRLANKETFKKHIESLLVHLNEPEPENIEILRKQFIDYNTKMDRLGKNKFTDVYPELLDFYAKYSTI
jgi:uncharacterized Fe-S cluster-containing radical SAM superfamily protein